MKKEKTKYTEPTDFIPKEIRKKNKIGEFAENTEKAKTAKKERSVLNEEFRRYVNSEE